MAYVALYRKYRSQSFDELMGQDATIRVLQNAIASGRIGHSYLFTGARGCGKTSTARLLARALNCVHQDGPTPNPCGHCRLCVSIREGTCMDVVEMDAASETGIDDVREKIIENVQYAPGEARYKVYIIDEVHDLSAKAFDALLKTLEEPPPHVVFILATTEFHKVPITIRSRCQNFAFKRGTLADLGASVARVVKAEGYTAEPEAVQAVARAAEGSWRDALSILEQVMAYSEGEITAATVHKAIGTVGTATLAAVTETLGRGAWDDTLTIAAQLVDSGTDVRQLLTALQGHLRDLLLLSAGAKQTAAQELGADRIALLTPQATLFEPATLLDMMAELSAAEREVRNTNQHRWLLERTLLRLMLLGQGITSARAVAAPRPAVTENTQSRQTKSEMETLPLAATPSPIPKPPVLNTLHGDTPSVNSVEEESEPDAPEPILQTAPPAVEPILPTAATHTAPASEPEAIPEDNSHRFADDISLEVIQRAWPRILKLIEKTSPSAITYLKKAEVNGLQGKTVILSFTEAFARDRIQNKGRDLVEKKVNEALKADGYRVQCILRGQDDIGGAGVGMQKPLPTGGGGAALEMNTLLDAPVSTAPPATRSIMDFEMPPPPSPSTNGTNGGGDVQTTNATRAPATENRPTTSAPLPPEPSALPVSDGLLAETLTIFGGEVVHSE